MNDVNEQIRSGKTSPFQVFIIFFSILVSALDGFDVLVAAFTAPTISQEWSLNPTQVGMILSSGLVGMMLGGIFLAPLGDRLGRRPTLILCLLILFVGMAGTATSTSLSHLIAWRVFTGLGIGVALISINILVLEFTPERRRYLAMSLVTIGYPAGATLGGLAAAYLIRHWGWEYVYLMGGVIALVLLPIALLFLPESLAFLIEKKPANALATINRTLRKMRLPALAQLPARPANAPQATRVRDIFSPGMRSATIASSLAYFSFSITIYFLLSWTPRIITGLGFSQEQGIQVSTIMNAGGVLGCLLYGFYAQRLGARRLAAVFMVGLCLLTVVFGLVPAELTWLMVAAAAVGFCINSCISSLYSVVPFVFPTAIRTTATGFAHSAGRVGAALGPFVAGQLIAQEWQRSVYIPVLALPMLLAALCLFWIRTPTQPGQHSSA